MDGGYGGVLIQSTCTEYCILYTKRLPSDRLGNLNILGSRKRLSNTVWNCIAANVTTVQNPPVLIMLCVHMRETCSVGAVDFCR